MKTFVSWLASMLICAVTSSAIWGGLNSAGVHVGYPSVFGVMVGVFWTIAGAIVVASLD